MKKLFFIALLFAACTHQPKVVPRIGEIWRVCAFEREGDSMDVQIQSVNNATTHYFRLGQPTYSVFLEISEFVKEARKVGEIKPIRNSGARFVDMGQSDPNSPINKIYLQGATTFAGLTRPIFDSAASYAYDSLLKYAGYPHGMNYGVSGAGIWKSSIRRHKKRSTGLIFKVDQHDGPDLLLLENGHYFMIYRGKETDLDSARARLQYQDSISKEFRDPHWRVGIDTIIVDHKDTVLFNYPDTALMLDGIYIIPRDSVSVDSCLNLSMQYQAL